MSELVIKKNTNLTFTFILDGDTDNAVIDNQPNMTSTGVYFNFKTKNGANIIKKQFIQYSQITYKDVSDVEFTFLSVQDVWTKLINEGFFDYLGTSGGGGGLDRFDELEDTFSYIGNDGKVPVINQAELKLEPVTFYNFKDFIQLEDVSISELIEGKILSVALVSGVPKVVLTDAPSDPVQLANVAGYFRYSDDATFTTPINLVASTDTQLTNDTLGTTTLTSNAPYGISTVLDLDTNNFDFSELSLGDQVEITINVAINTTVLNQTVRGILKVAEGSLVQEDKVFFEDEFSGIDTYNITRTVTLAIDVDEFRLNPSALYINTNDTATLTVNYYYVRILRKGINIVDIDLVVDEAISDDLYNDIVLGSDGKLYVGGLVKKQYASSYSYSTGTTNAVYSFRPEGKSVYNLTGASLVSVSGFNLDLIDIDAEQLYDGKIIRLINSTGNEITLNDNDDTNAEVPFLMKNGANLAFPANETIEFSFSGNLLNETFRSWSSATLDPIDTTGFKVLSPAADNVQTAFDEVDLFLLRARNTGYQYGGLFSYVGNNVSFTSGGGGILDLTDEANPDYYNVTWPAFTSIASSVSSGLNYWYIDTTGALQQTTTTPTPESYRQRIWLVRTSHTAGAITGSAYIGVAVQNTAVNLRDFATAIGRVKVSGIDPQPSGANLKLKISAGVLFSYAGNREDFNNPSNVPLALFDSGVSSVFRYATSSGVIATDVTDIDVTHYQVGGVVTAIPGASSRYGVHYIWVFENGNTRIVYGNNYYATLTEARASLTDVNPYAIAPSGFNNAFLLGAYLATKGTTDLNSATFVSTNKFGFFGSGASSGGITEAPVDGKYYARKNGAWAELPVTILAQSMTSSSSVTGTTANTIVVQNILIPANTVQVGDILTLKCRCERTVVTSGTTGITMSISTVMNDTVGNLSGANRKFTGDVLTTTNRYVGIEHDIYVKNATVSETISITSFGDNVQTSNKITNNIDWEVDQYFYIYVNNAQTDTTTYISGYSIERKRA